MLLTLRQRIIFFICISIVGFLIAGLSCSFLLSKYPDSTAHYRIAAVLQSVFQLIMPAIVTAILISRQPARFLSIDSPINGGVLSVALVGLIAATPIMNYIIMLNESIHLPSSLSHIEDALRNMEENASISIKMILGSGGIANAIMNILIVGVLAGFGEELFFRGTFMRLMTTGGINHHVAIWVSAIVFSAIHLQFFGFVPRMILGAYFGYLLYWSRCLWIPILIHAANNIMYLLIEASGDETAHAANKLGIEANTADWVSIAISIVICVAALGWLSKHRVSHQ